MNYIACVKQMNFFEIQQNHVNNFIYSNWKMVKLGWLAVVLVLILLIILYSLKYGSKASRFVVYGSLLFIAVFIWLGLTYYSRNNDQIVNPQKYLLQNEQKDLSQCAG